jgi:hypothetical protein
MKNLNCCHRARWNQAGARDLGRVAEFEFVLSRCGNCGAWWMSIYCAAVSTDSYEPVSGEDAQKMLALPPGPELKAFLKGWEKEHT